ncbi:SCNN1B [Mytilus coruscus]|uniref:SCNN1B n=1 Tax=Mytilus coruscus TaxID=42192 RepID=A0A6J8BP75_MYTCO|nr:SCNN1B [Mytilus coruscus]
MSKVILRISWTQDIDNDLQLINFITYQSYPTQTNVKLDFKPLKMPAITICNMNPIRRTKIDELSSELIQKILIGSTVTVTNIINDAGSMRITLKINLENYKSLALSEGYGAILMIREYGQEHPEDRALIVSGGTETHIKLQMGCIKHCLEEAYSQYCQCQNNLIVKNDTDNYIGQKYCKETPYETQPGVEALMTEVCSPIGNCTANNITMSSDELEHNFLKLLIYFGDLNHEIITEEPVYTFTRLLSDVGGSLGLCLGVSLLCICKLVEVLVDIIQTAVKKVCKRKS